MAPPRNATNPACPDPRHAGSRVRIHGTYRPSHRGSACLHHARVRFLCVRPDVRPHTFSTGRRLPRDGECDSCDRGFTLRDGPLAPRRFMHVVPDIARSLVLVGQGHSYRRAGRLTRVKSGVIRFHPKRAGQAEEGGSDWGLVADWVELYAEAATRGSLPEAWPSGGIIVDQIPFAAGGQVYTQATGASRGVRTTWSIACAMGPHGPGNRLRMLRMRAFPSKAGTAGYEALFRELPGQPTFVLADGESSIRSAAQRVWPGITVYVAFDKLELQLEAHLSDARLKGSIHPLWSQKGKWDSRDPAQLSIFRDLGRWYAYCAAVRAAAVTHPGTRAYLLPWVTNHEHTVAAQIGAMPFWPHEATAMEHAQAKVRAWFEGRSWPMRNQARTNRLLDLMTCELAETARQRSYARRIRAHLEGSLPLGLRHQVYRAPRLH